MLVLKCQIQIGNKIFSQVESVTIKKSFDNLTDTAVIKLPDTKKNLEDLFKEGEAVQISLGYAYHEMNVEFEGYVKKIKPNVPLEIECEDATYLLRKQALSKYFKNTTLKEVVNFLVSGTKIKVSGSVPDVKLDAFRLNKEPGCTALQMLKESYGFNAFFIGNELYVGLDYTATVAEKVKYELGRNVISTNLEYQKEENQKLKIKAVGILKDNKRIEVEVGDKDGALRTLYFYNVSDTNTLKSLAEKERSRLIWEGYKGSFTSFLLPFAQFGMNAEYKDTDYPQRAGTYKIRAIEVGFGSGGGRRKIELGEKVI